MTLEDEIASTLSEQIAKQIDKELLDDIMLNLLTKDGWTRARINPAFTDIVSNNDWYTTTAEWIHLNIRGDYKLLKGEWIFEDAKDATLFILRWS